MQAGIDSHRYANEQGQYDRDEGEFQSSRHALQQHILHGTAVHIGKAEIAFRGVDHVIPVLDHEWIVQAQGFPQLFPVLQRGFLTHQIINGIAHKAEKAKRNQRNGQHD